MGAHVDVFAVAEAEYAKALGWRQEAANSLLPGLQAYDAEIRDNIGLRQQDKMPTDVALSVASCLAVPADLTLEF